MASVHAILLTSALLIFVAGMPTYAQNVEFLPEMDAYLKLNPAFRAYLEAKDDRDAGDPQQFEIGPSIQLYLKPLITLKDVAAFDLDDSKHRVLVLETGYRYITAPTAAPEDRMMAVVTFNFPMKAGFHISDRNRADLDWKSGGFNWRYRNKLTVQRTFAFHNYHLIPYVAAEPYYTSQYSKWSTTALYAGSLFPLGKHLQFNAYYKHENNTGEQPNQQKNAIGLALYLYFSIKNTSP